MDCERGQAMRVPLQEASGRRQEASKRRGSGGMEGSKTWGAGASSRAHGGEVDEESKKNHNIINIIREGQISLLVGDFGSTESCSLVITTTFCHCVFLLAS